MNGNGTKILLVEDNPGDARLIREELKEALGGKFSLVHADCLETCLNLLEQKEFDVILLDLGLPDSQGFDTLVKVRANAKIKVEKHPIIILTGLDSEDMAIMALREGAQDYLVKGQIDARILKRAIQYSIERKKNREELHESEEKYRQLVETLQEGIWVIDANARTTFANRRMAEMLGYTIEDMIGKHLFEFMDEKGRETAQRNLEKRKQGIKEQHEFEFVRKNGSRLYALLETAPLLDEKKKYTGAIAGILDITDRKRAEEKLEQYNLSLATINALAIELASFSSNTNIKDLLPKRLKEITGAYAVTFSDYDPKERVLAVNQIEIESGILGKITQKLGKRLEEVRSPVSKETYREILSDVIGRRQTLTEVSFGAIPRLVGDAIRKLTGIDHFIGIAYVIEDELYGTSLLAMKGGTPEPSDNLLKSFAHLAAVSLRQRRAEEALKESEDKYRNLFHNAQVGLFRIRIADGKMVECNDLFAEMLGYKSREDCLRDILSICLSLL